MEKTWLKNSNVIIELKTIFCVYACVYVCVKMLGGSLPFLSSF